MHRIAALLIAALVAAAPATAASQMLVAGTGETPLRLRIDGQTVAIDDRGARFELPLGTSVDAFATTRGGWLAVGSKIVTGGRELVLWSGGDGKGDGLTPPLPLTLPAPPGRVGAVRAFPVPLLRDGELVGLAWLEGEAADRFAVRAAAWDGGEWSEPQSVAPPGPGSQLALTGTVLADGSWLLAWSAFDGEDDEVVWSLRRGNGRWSAPAPVAAGNAVPDVTPTVRADGDGALLAWTRYDGN
ncbi:MAG TPA: hypothetical protein VN811_03885, partial [Thermoanaerobaculia bacterium]|nr:hypothetical protein [Thermoanaerobaculia bacterium]